MRTQRIRPHLSYANVTGTLGLFIALGGTSYAALALPPNSVGSAQIKAKAVKSSDLGSSAVTSAKVKNQSLLAADFARGQLPAGAPGPAGAMGAPGTAGATGATGAQGPPGTFGAISVQRADFSVPEGMTAGLQVVCPVGTRAIGGGSALDNTSAEGIYLTVSRPFRTAPGADGDKPVNGESFDAWRVAYRNKAGETGTASVNAWAICAQT